MPVSLREAGLGVAPVRDRLERKDTSVRSYMGWNAMQKSRAVYAQGNVGLYGASLAGPVLDPANFESALCPRQGPRAQGKG